MMTSGLPGHSSREWREVKRQNSQKRKQHVELEYYSIILWESGSS